MFIYTIITVSNVRKLRGIKGSRSVWRKRDRRQVAEKLSIIQHIRVSPWRQHHKDTLSLQHNILGFSAVLLWMTSNEVEGKKERKERVMSRRPWARMTPAPVERQAQKKFQNQIPPQLFLKVSNLKRRSREITLKITLPLVWIRRKGKRWPAVSSHCILGNV